MSDNDFVREMRRLTHERATLYLRLRILSERIAKLMHTRWPCGHPRTAENTAKVGKAGVRCRECKNARNRRWRNINAAASEAIGEAA